MLKSWADFFLSVVEGVCDNQSLAEYLWRSGVRAADWPTCRAKDYMMDFEFLSQTRDYETARFEISLRMKSDNASFPIKIPDKPQEVKVLIDLEREKGLAIELSDRIRVDPLNVHREILAFKNSNSKAQLITFSDAIKSVIEKREEQIKSNTAIVEIPDWPLLSNAIGGFNPGRVGIITAATGIGKTNLAINLAISKAKTSDVLFINMEMIIDDLVKRNIFSLADISYSEWSRNSFEVIEKRINKVIEYKETAKEIYFTDGKSLSITEIAGLIYSSVETKETKFIIVDYDQKIKSQSRGEEWQQLQASIEELEEVAKATGSFILVLSQADDSGDPKASKRIKQSASFVMHLKKLENEMFGDIYALEVLKNRFGKNKVCIKLEYKQETSKITEAGIVENDNRPSALSGHRDTKPNSSIVARFPTSNPHNSTGYNRIGPK